MTDISPDEFEHTGHRYDSTEDEARSVYESRGYDAPPEDLGDTSRLKESRAWYGRDELDKTVWEATLERIDFLYDSYDEIVVFFSGGKDSTAVMQATLHVAEARNAPPPRVAFFDEEVIPPETVEYVRRCIANLDIDLQWICTPVKHRNGCSSESPWMYPWDPDCPELWVREWPEEGEALPGIDFPGEPEKRWDMTTAGKLCFRGDRKSVSILGIRAAESLTRRGMIANRKVDPWISPDSTGAKWLDKAYPIYDWNEVDVWSAPKIHGWDYNRFYEVLEALGIKGGAQRCGAPYGEEPMRRLWSWQQTHPEMWDKMVARVPGAQAAARYGHTGLYGTGSEGRSSMPKPAGMTWRQHLRSVIEAQTDEKIRAQLARSMGQIIRSHFNKTDDPILPDTNHPVTCISWNSLIRIVVIGDVKGRQIVNMLGPGHRGERDTYWAEYNRLKQEGLLDECL